MMLVSTDGASRFVESCHGQGAGWLGPALNPFSMDQDLNQVVVIFLVVHLMPERSIAGPDYQRSPFPPLVRSAYDALHPRDQVCEIGFSRFRMNALEVDQWSRAHAVDFRESSFSLLALLCGGLGAVLARRSHDRNEEAERPRDEGSIER